MDDFSTQIVRELQTRGIVPVPRWHFLLKRSVFWSLAVTSILVGAVAVSVADYVFFDNEGVSTAVLLESPLESIIQLIPFVWIVVFGLFVASAYLSLRHTRTGYRLGTATSIGGVIIVSIILGVALNTVDFGQAVHYYLLHHTTFYDAFINSNDDKQIPF
jgi:uncharacterized membrane protein